MGRVASWMSPSKVGSVEPLLQPRETPDQIAYDQRAGNARQRSRPYRCTGGIGNLRLDLLRLVRQRRRPFGSRCCRVGGAVDGTMHGVPYPAALLGPLVCNGVDCPVGRLRRAFEIRAGRRRRIGISAVGGAATNCRGSIHDVPFRRRWKNSTNETLARLGCGLCTDAKGATIGVRLM